MSFVGLALVSILAQSQTVRLNGPLAQPRVGTILGYRTGAEGTHVVYLGDQNEPGRPELWAAPLDGSTPAIVLNPPLAPGQELGRSFEVDAACTQAAFLHTGRIWRAPTDGSAPALALTAPIPIEDTGNYAFPFSPDGDWIVYKHTLHVDAPLFSVPSDGSGAPIELWAEAKGGVPSFAISPDSARVVLVSTGPAADLHSVPIDGSAAPVRLSGAAVPGTIISGFRLGPQGIAVYRGDQDTSGVVELYSVPIDGSAAPVKLSGSMTTGGDVSGLFGDFAITPDGARVVYLADQDVDEQVELYSAPSDGSAAPLKLSGVLAAGGDVRSFLVAPDGRHVLFLADRDPDEVLELYLVPVWGGLAPTKVSAPLVPGGDVSRYLVSDDSRFVVYRADQEQDGIFELYTTPIGRLRRGETPRALRLNPPLAPGASLALAFELTGDGRVLYRASQLADGREGQFLVPLRGGPSQATRATSLAPDGSGLFIDSASELGGQGLHSVALVEGAMPVRLSAEPPIGPVEGDVHAYRPTPDGSQVVFLADQEHDEVFELFRVAADGASLPARLSGALVTGGDVGGYAFPSVESFAIAPDGMCVAYVADQEIDDRVELFVVPMDGSAAPQRLSGDPGPILGVQHGPRFTPDGQRLLYRAFRSSFGILELFGVPVDGSTEPVALSGTLISDGDVEPDFAISADGGRAVFRADASTVDKLELYSAPVEGGGPRVRLNASMSADRDVTSFQLDPSGQYVLYRADQAGDELYEIYRVPIAGGAASVRVHPSLPPGRSVRDYAVTPDGAHVVYLADQEVDERYELYAVPLTGGAPAKLSGSLVSGGDVGFDGRFGVVSPDGTRVLYVADQEVDERYELYSAPIDGSRPAVKVSDALPAGGDVFLATTPGVSTLEVSADGRTVVFAASAQAPGTFQLWAARTDGLGTPRALSPLAAGSVGQLVLDPTGLQALFVTHEPGDLEARQAYRVLLEGGPALPLVSGISNVRECTFTPDLRRALFRTDGGGDGIFELFSTRLERLPRRAGPP